jgi:tetratricopeptide (TPR) repeat protein
MLLLTGLLGCAQDASPPPVEAPAVIAAPPQLTEIALPVLTVAAPFRWDTEFRGLATTAMELGLSDLPGVTARIPGEAPPPTWALSHPMAERTYTATFSASGTEAALTLTLELCDATVPSTTSACVTHTATGPRQAPYPMFAALLNGVAEQLGLVPDAAAVQAWEAPGSKDSYAELITGRGCATYLGLLPPPTDPTDKKQNSVLRAIFIDPTQPIAQWMWARWQVYAVAGSGSAADALRRASLARPTSPLLMADLATTLELNQKQEEAALVWLALTEQAPDDPRWLIPYANTLATLGRTVEARSVLDKLPPSFQRDPVYAELQVRIAEGSGSADLEPLLAHWQDTDLRSPEPVRRRIRQRVQNGRYADALTLLPALRTRAPGPATDALEVALLTATGQLDAAADRAPEDVAARLRARSARETDPAAAATGLDDADAALATADARLWANEPVASLDAAEKALRLRPDADAWSARARALEASGRSEESVQSWQEAWQLDPATEGGPVSNQRIASTFRLQMPDSKPATTEAEEPSDAKGPNMGMEQ